MSLRIKLILGVAGIAFLVSGATRSYFYFQVKSGLYHALRQELVATAWEKIRIPVRLYHAPGKRQSQIHSGLSSQ